MLVRSYHRTIAHVASIIVTLPGNTWYTLSIVRNNSSMQISLY